MLRGMARFRNPGDAFLWISDDEWRNMTPRQRLEVAEERHFMDENRAAVGRANPINPTIDDLERECLLRLLADRGRQLDPAVRSFLSAIVSRLPAR